jgi:hypothetical protein
MGKNPSLLEHDYGGQKGQSVSIMRKDTVSLRRQA